MSQPEWRIILQVKRIIEALRNLMKSTLVDDDQAVDNALEIFRQACAEAIAQVTDYHMIHIVRLYAAFIVDSTFHLGHTISLQKSPADPIKLKLSVNYEESHQLVQRRLPMAK
jgi:hypothetical protein